MHASVNLFCYFFEFFDFFHDLSCAEEREDKVAVNNQFNNRF